ACADLLPKSVYDRVKSPYPSTQDPKYAAALQDQAKDLLTRPTHPVFDLVDHDSLHRVAHRETPVSTQAERRGLERALDLAQWMDIYRPEISLG
ncbi:asparagine synthase-related protein, partial [Streptomyces sp. NPDC002144]